MGWGDYFYYCYYYYCYYYYNYYLKNPHKTTDKKRRRHTNISQVPMASSAPRRVWGGGKHLLNSQPWDGRTDGQRSSSPAKEGSRGDARSDTRRCWRWRTQPIAGAGCECLGGHQGCRLWGREGQPRRLLAPFPAPWCSQTLRPSRAPPTLGGTLQPRAGGSSVLVCFFASGLEGLGGPGPVWMVTCS